MTPILVTAGIACMGAAIAHGYRGQTRLIKLATFANREAKALVSMIWHFSAAASAVCGAVIAASPWLFPDETRPIAVALACLPPLWGIVGNAWATRGRHFGWMVFAGIVVLALVGAVT